MKFTFQRRSPAGKRMSKTRFGQGGKRNRPGCRRCRGPRARQAKLSRQRNCPSPSGKRPGFAERKTFKRHPKSKANWPRRSKPLPIISSGCRRARVAESREDLRQVEKDLGIKEQVDEQFDPSRSAWRNWPSFRRKNFWKNSKRN